MQILPSRFPIHIITTLSLPLSSTSLSKSCMPHPATNGNSTRGGRVHIRFSRSAMKCQGREDQRSILGQARWFRALCTCIGSPGSWPLSRLEDRRLAVTRDFPCRIWKVDYVRIVVWACGCHQIFSSFKIKCSTLWLGVFVYIFSMRTRCTSTIQTKKSANDDDVRQKCPLIGLKLINKAMRWLCQACIFR